MPTYQNRARGTRVLQVKGPNGLVAPLAIDPGRTVENVEVVNTEDPVFQAMVENGEIVVDGGKQTRRQASAELEKLNARRQELEGELEKIVREQNVLATALNEPVYQNDRKFRDDRQAAMIAGHAPGLADKLPGDTNRESAPETLEAQGHDPAEAQAADPALGGIDAQKTAPKPANPFASNPPKNDQLQGQQPKADAQSQPKNEAQPQPTAEQPKGGKK